MSIPKAAKRKLGVDLPFPGKKKIKTPINQRVTQPKTSTPMGGTGRPQSGKYGMQRPIPKSNDPESLNLNDPFHPKFKGATGRPKIGEQGNPDLSQPPIPKSSYYPGIVREQMKNRPTQRKRTPPAGQIKK